MENSMIKQSPRLKLIFTLTIISVFQFFTSCTFTPWTFTPKQLNEWIKNPDTNRCIKNKKCRSYLKLAINDELLEIALKKTDKDSKWLWAKPTNEVNITKLRKGIIKIDTSHAKTPDDEKAVKLFSKVYTNMPSSDEPNDYDTIMDSL